MKTLLVVTWFIAGQPITGYEAPFETAQACDEAAAVVLAEAQQIAVEAHEQAQSAGGTARLKARRAASQQVMVSCVPQQGP